MFSRLMLSAVAAGAATGILPGGGAAGETTTPAAGAAGATPAAPATPAKPRAKRGEGAVRFATKDLAQAGKTAGGSQHVFGAKMGDGAEKFYLASHRATVMGAVLNDYGIKLKDYDVQERPDAAPAVTADAALAKLSDDERRQLFEKYMSGGNFSAAAGLPAAGAKRDDTAPGFTEAAGNGGGKPQAAAAQRGTSTAKPAAAGGKK